MTSKQVDNLFGIISALSKLIARDTEMADNSKAKINPSWIDNPTYDKFL